MEIQAGSVLAPLKLGELCVQRISVCSPCHINKAKSPSPEHITGGEVNPGRFEVQHHKKITKAKFL